MDGAISFTICSLFFSILLIIVYFSKKRFPIIENKIYSVLIITNLIGLIIHILCGVVTPMIDGDLNSIVISKLYLIYLLTWILLFTIYIFIISRKNDDDKKYYMKLFSYFSIIYIICIMIIILM